MIKVKPEHEVIKILVVEDNPDDAELLSEMFAEFTSPTFESTCVSKLGEAKKILEKERFHLTLCDLSLPDAKGLEALKILRECDPITPIIVLTGRNDELMAIHAIEQGAQDYLVKGMVDPQLLVRSMRHAISRNRALGRIQREQFKEHVHTGEQDQLKTNLIAFVSHELQTPLTTITGYASLLKNAGIDKVDKAPEYLKNILNQVKRMNRLIEDFLNIAKIESGHPLELIQEAFDVRELLQGVIETETMLTSRTKFETFIDERVKILRADRYKILQVLVNLLSNAEKYSPRGSIVKIQIAQENSSLRFKVIDQGIGIPEEAIKNLFTPFYRADNPEVKKIPGTGLGLYLCKHLVEAHGGRIGVESKLGQGTTFWFTIPLALGG